MKQETIDFWLGELPGKKIRHVSQSKTSYIYVYAIKHEEDSFVVEGEHDWMQGCRMAIFIPNNDIEEWHLYEK